MKTAFFAAFLLCSTAYSQTPNAPPVITSLTITKLGYGYVFSGMVSDEVPKGLTVVFTGPIGIHLSQATVNADGTFWALINYNGGSATVEAIVVDWKNLSAKKTATIP